MSEIQLPADRRKLVEALSSLISYAESIGIAREELLSSGKKYAVPASAFRHLPGLEAVVKYLRENCALENIEIAELLSRSIKTVWASYERAKKVMPGRIPDSSEFLIPADEFANRRLSILENVVYFLKREGLNTKKIAEILGKDYKTIWTIARRAEIKNAQQI